MLSGTKDIGEILDGDKDWSTLKYTCLMGGTTAVSFFAAPVVENEMKERIPNSTIRHFVADTAVIAGSMLAIGILKGCKTGKMTGVKAGLALGFIFATVGVIAAEVFSATKKEKKEEAQQPAEQSNTRGPRGR